MNYLKDLHARLKINNNNKEINSLQSIPVKQTNNKEIIKINYNKKIYILISQKMILRIKNIRNQGLNSRILSYTIKIFLSFITVLKIFVFYYYFYENNKKTQKKIGV